MTEMKIVSMQELAKIYFDNIGESNALLKIMEECGELVRALAKFIAVSGPDETKMQEAFNHVVSESIDVYVTLMWLFGSLDRTTIQQEIGIRLVEVLNKLELTQKLVLDEEVVQIEHGLPIGVRVGSVKVEKPGLKIVQ